MLSHQKFSNQVEQKSIKLNRDKSFWNITIIMFILGNLLFVHFAVKKSEFDQNFYPSNSEFLPKLKMLFNIDRMTPGDIT